MKKYLSLVSILCILFGQCAKTGAASDFTSSIGQGGSMARFAIVGEYMYAVDDQQLHVWDLHDPAKPVETNKIDVGFSVETIFPLKDRLFIGSSTVVHIFDISDPASPKKLSEAISPSTLRHCDPVVAKDNVAYATLRSNGPCGGTLSILAVYDITEISQPAEVATFPLQEPYGLGYSGDVLYVCDKAQGLIILDISKPFSPTRIGALTDGDYVDVIPYGPALICWTSDGMILYDITDNRKPILAAKIN